MLEAYTRERLCTDYFTNKFIGKIEATKLSMLGWTQGEIGQLVGIDQSVVSRIMQNGEIAKMHNSIQDWLDKGKSIEEAAASEMVDFRLALLWH